MFDVDGLEPKGNAKGLDAFAMNFFMKEKNKMSWPRLMPDANFGGQLRALTSTT